MIYIHVEGKVANSFFLFRIESSNLRIITINISHVFIYCFKSLYEPQPDQVSKHFMHPEIGLAMRRWSVQVFFLKLPSIDS